MATTSASAVAAPSPPALQVNGAPTAPAAAESNGKRVELRMAMLKKLRPYPLRHEWVFWHERNNPNAAEEQWSEQLKEIAQISTVQSFWQVFNNTPFSSLPLRDSLHLFKKNVKPMWEDPRNKNGGAWTFRVPKANSLDFWREILMSAIGEEMQEVVEKGDDICGVSISVRFNSHLIMVWNRDGNNESSTNKILNCILGSLSEELKPAQQNYYYKKHSAHKSFKGAGESGGETTPPVKPRESATLPEQKIEQ